MGMIRDALAEQMAREAVVLDLGDLRAQAAAIRAQAEREAERIVEEARARRETILAGARDLGMKEGREAGFSQGIEEGRNAGREEAVVEQRERLSFLIDAWTAALASFEEARETLRRDAREDVLSLALRLAEKVTKRLVELDERTASRQLEAALEVALGAERMTIRIHPEDRAVVEEDLPSIALRLGGGGEAELVDDASLARGSCVVRTERGEVDAEIDRQIARLVDGLAPLARDGDAPGAASDAGDAERDS